MVGYILSALLVMMPLPGLPALPDGAEVRIVSPDLRTVYLFWLVEKGSLKLQARPLAIPEGSRVRLLIRTGRELHAYEGRYIDGDVFVETPKGFISIKQAFTGVYKLRWPRADEALKGVPAEDHGAGDDKRRPPANPGRNGNGPGRNTNPGADKPGGGSDNGNGKGRNGAGAQSLGAPGGLELQKVPSVEVPYDQVPAGELQEVDDGYGGADR